MLDTRVTTASLAPSGLRPLPCGGRPILLLHGFLATPRALGRLAVRLRRSGYRAHCVDLGGLFGRFNTRTVEEMACILAERVEQLACDHPGERIDLVGHSQGGLVGRYYVQKLNGAHRVRHLVTLGTPHRGTPWARSGHLVGRTLPSLRRMPRGRSSCVTSPTRVSPTAYG